MNTDVFFSLSRHFLKTYNRPYRRYFLNIHRLENRFSIITGQRGVGKTTAMVQYILSQYQGDISTHKALYVPVDHFSVGSKSLFEIAETFYNLGVELICFDEIHKHMNWSGELKSIYDSFPNLKIIASGSSAMKIERGSHDLSRRALFYRMAGLSFREYVDLVLDKKTQPIQLQTILENHEHETLVVVDVIEREHKKILALFRDYLEYGYYPYFDEFDDVSLYHITLEQSMHTTIESDLISIYPSLTGETIKKLKKLLSIIAESVPFTPDLKRLKKSVEIGDERTLKNYLKYLEDGGVIISLWRTGHGLKEMEKPEKIYLNNPNQIHAISGKGNVGNIRETFFINMLSLEHKVSIPKIGDFFVDDRYTFEIGGKSKTFKQIQDIQNSFLAIDDIEIGIGRKIPLWIFGFLY
ncbi:MAG: hypothetical protein A2161_19440 [Candidatus Schekmanbacteria bacterium RBG_13_48_7]|uniref:AAA domain-containing protein n=1 Tax=Candidatus Schekmanbacteria bacterium RBG_13_48_7 TaxID=1817878 RepID=A0A1F7RVC5_9BACT|nr:MAG: hypothetical protein A2161_19440 [Candidatus Schekmanbacteria bacterium RBG_13_48_7]